MRPSDASLRGGAVVADGGRVGERLGVEQVGLGLGAVDEAALRGGCLGVHEELAGGDDVRHGDGALGVVDAVRDVLLELEQVAVDLVGEGLHRRDEELCGEVDDAHRQLLGRDGERHVEQLVHLDGDLALRGVLHLDLGGELLGLEGGGLADGDGVAHARDELGGVVAVDEVGHDGVGAQNVQRLVGDDVGCKDGVRHRNPLASLLRLVLHVLGGAHFVDVLAALALGGVGHVGALDGRGCDEVGPVGLDALGELVRVLDSAVLDGHALEVGDLENGVDALRVHTCRLEQLSVQAALLGCGLLALDLGLVVL